MLAVLCALTVAAVSMPVAVKICGRWAFALAATIPAVCFGWVLNGLVAGKFHGDTAPRLHYEWMPQAHLAIDFHMDSVSALFALIVLGVGTLVLIYCAGYFEGFAKRLTIFGGQMVAFAAAMFGLVIADSLLVVYIFWEITSILSFLLVGYYGERASSRRAAGQALMVTVAGGLAMLVGIVILGINHNVWSFTDLQSLTADEVAASSSLHVAFACLLMGIVTKSALAPTHFWLPQAMAAPTPVSAYLHSAAMVKAGVYLVARIAPVAHFWPQWQVLVIPAGLLTMLLGGWMAIKQRDLKLVLAYGTISQLGFMVAILGVGTPLALQAGLVLVVAHACFKSALFMVVGVIDHATGTRDVRRLSGLGRAQPVPATIAALACLSMAGIPPTMGFVAKETVLGMLLEEQKLIGMPATSMTIVVVAGSLVTVVYSTYFFFGAFGLKKKLPIAPLPADASAAGGTQSHDGVVNKSSEVEVFYASRPGHRRSGIKTPSEAVVAAHHSSAVMLFPPALLAGLSLVGGLIPTPVGHLVDASALALSPLEQTVYLPHLALWHGWTLPLLLTAVVIVGGVVMFSQLASVATLFFARPAMGDAQTAYDAVINSLRSLSLRLTATTQKGSLPVNEATILATLVLLPTAALIAGDRMPVTIRLWDHPVQAVVCAVVIVAALYTTVLRHRLSALIVVGVTGLGIAALFALHGAPDLALTQLVVETLTVVVCVLQFRRLPAFITAPKDPVDPRFRAWLAAASGLVIVVLGAFAQAARVYTPVGTVIGDLAATIGHGANAVNVLLVDIRAFDTFGEISVLAVVAVGVSSLVYRTRTFTRRSSRPTLTTHEAALLAVDPLRDTTTRPSMMIDVAARLLFHPMLIVAAYLFFSGHNAPGGGFAAGLVIGLAISLRYLAGGAQELEYTLPVNPSTLLGSGLLIAGGTAAAPLLKGLAPFTSTLWDVHIPLVGDVHIVSAMILDVGVLLIVVGLVMHVLSALGVQLDKDQAVRERRRTQKTPAPKKSSAAAPASAHTATTTTAAATAQSTVTAPTTTTTTTTTSPNPTPERSCNER